MSERALYFPNERGQRLFASLTIPDSAARRDLGVLFCHPFGEEKQLSYRPIVRFARFLCTHGFSSFRFDCAGFGDSEGELAEHSMESIVADLSDALGYFVDQSGLSKVALIGVRFGGIPASILASRDARVAALALISPTVSGADYWETLLRTQQLSYLTSGVKGKSKPELLEELDKHRSLEVTGDRVSKVFVQQLSKIDLSDLRLDRKLPLFICTTDGGLDERTAEFLSARENAGSDLTTWLSMERDFWSTVSTYDGYVPIELFERTEKWLRNLGR